MKVSIEAIVLLKNKQWLPMELLKSGTINDWTSMKFIQKFKKLEAPTTIRGIFLGVYNTSNTKVFFILCSNFTIFLIFR